MIRRAAILAVAVSLAAPAAAQAHAVLERTSPEQGATVRSEPDSVAFFFNEPVEASFGAVKVFNARGDEVQSGEAFRPGGHDEGIATRLARGLADGTYTATYHVISADSHPVSGGFTFSIGKATAGGGQSVAAVLDREQAGPAVSVAFWADRLAGYAAIAIAIGALVFTVAIWRPALARVAGPEARWLAAAGSFTGRLRAIVGGAIVVGLASSLLALPLQVATASGSSFWSALDPDLISEVLGTRFGVVMAIRAGAWVVLAAVLAVLIARRPAGALRPATLGATGTAPAPSVGRAALVAAAIPALALLATPALAGHASTQSPQAVLTAAAILHVTAMSVWAGGLVALVFALPRATAELEMAERSRLLMANLARFSPFALVGVIVLAATGTIQAIAEVGSFSALVDTGFGRAVLAKIALLAVLIGLGAANRQRLIPALGRLAGACSPAGPIGVALRRNLRLEVSLIAVVLGVTAVLVSYAPPSQQAAGPVSGRTTIGSEVLEYTVAPARAGANSIHLYLFDADTGAQFDGAREVSVQLTEPDRGIGPLDADPHKSGPGHYTAQAAQFGAPGDWTMTVSVRTSRFDEDQAEVQVPIE